MIEKTRVMFVDDEPGELKAWERSLSTRPYIVFCASSAAEALDELKKREYDVAVVDYLMPDMRGSELVAEMKGIRPSVKVILISGAFDHESYPESEAKTDTKELLNCERFMRKPVALADLVQAISALADARGAVAGCSPMAEFAKRYTRAAAVRGQARKVTDKMEKGLRRTRPKS
jgi:CheY-like chemotaxis protein